MENTAVTEEDGGFSLKRVSFFLIVRGFALACLSLLVFALLHVYIGRHLLLGAAGWVAMTALYLSIPASLIATRMKAGWPATALRWVGYLWLGSFGLLLTLTVASDLVRAVWTLAGGAVGPEAAPIQALAIAAGFVPALAWGLFSARRPRLVRRSFPMRGLGADLQGMKVVQLSDVHVGPTLGRRFLQSVVDRVNALDPDVIVITGDLIDGAVNELREKVEPLQSLRSKLGKFYVTGNHEMYHGPSAWEIEVERLGVTVLHNEHRVLERGGAKLVLAGVPDHDGEHFSAHHAVDVERAFRGAPEGAPRLLLAHQPRSARLAAPHRVDLQLSGHTHGGQIFPFMFFVRLQQPVIAGLREIEGVRVYTSRGTGYWGPPLRIGASPEITEILLTS